MLAPDPGLLHVAHFDQPPNRIYCVLLAQIHKRRVDVGEVRDLGGEPIDENLRPDPALDHLRGLDLRHVHRGGDLRGQRRLDRLFDRFGRRSHLLHLAARLLRGGDAVALCAERFHRLNGGIGDAAEREAQGRPIPEDVARALRRLVADAATAGEVVDIYAAADLTRPDFDALTPAALARMQQAAHPHLAIEALRNTLLGQASLAGGRNLVREREFSERLAAIMLRYTNAQLTAAEVMAELYAMAQDIAELRTSLDLVLVEGAGGLLVPFDAAGRTIVDLAAGVAQRTAEPVAVVVVADPALGTLNHTALTLAALASTDLELAGVVLGSWPADPDLACRCNLADLPGVIGGPLAGVLPAGAAALDPADFAAAAVAGMAPRLGGTFGGTIAP